MPWMILKVLYEQQDYIFAIYQLDYTNKINAYLHIL